MRNHVVNWLRFTFLVFFLPELFNVSDSYRKRILFSFVSCTHRWQTIDDPNIFLFPQMLARGTTTSVESTGRFSSGEILRSFVSSGAWLESTLWTQKVLFLYKTIEIQETLFICGKEMGKQPWGASLSSVRCPRLPVSCFLCFFSSMNLKHGGLCLVLQEFLKWLFGINRCVELNSQNYPSHDFGVLANCCKYSEC